MRNEQKKKNKGAARGTKSRNDMYWLLKEVVYLCMPVGRGGSDYGGNGDYG